MEPTPVPVASAASPVASARGGADPVALGGALTPGGSAGSGGSSDGRRARSERTRAAVLDSIIEYVNAGEAPTTAEVAARAGISERSLFRHFESRDGLFDAAIDRFIGSLLPMVREVPATGTVDERLDAMLAVRAPLYEAMTPMRRVAPIYAARSEQVARRTAETRRWFRQEVARTFGPELSTQSGAERRDLLDAVDLALSWEAWDHLRTAGSSVARSRRILAATARALLSSS